MARMLVPSGLHASTRRMEGLPVHARPRPHASPVPIDLSIVVTVFNEQDSLVDLYQELVSALSGSNWELILVDDGSQDGSFDIASSLHEQDRRVSVARFRRNFGKTAALLAGISLARGGVVVTMDGDLQDNPREIPRLLETLDKGYDLVTGWRQVRSDSPSKRLSSWLFNRTVSLVTGVHLHDINCGLKVLRSEVARDLKLYGELHRFVPVLAHQRGYRVTELAVNHRRRQHGRSKYGWSRALSALLDIQTVVFLSRYLGKPLRLFGTAGLLLLALGTAFGAYLSLLRFQGQTIGARPLLLLSVLLVVSGIQLLSTGLIGEMLRNVSFDRREEYSIETLLYRDSKNGG